MHKDSERGGIVLHDYAKDKLLDNLPGSDPLYMNDMGGNWQG